MKRLYKAAKLMVYGLLISMGALGQARVAAPFYLTSYALPITNHKTTHLLFPAAIVSVDRGSTAVLAQIAKGVEHILQVKAGSEHFPETNLTVITADGKLYSFEVCYDPNPKQLNLTFEKNERSLIGKMDRVQATAARLHQTASQNPVTSKRKNGLQVALQRIYVQDEVLYFLLTLTNTSPLSYTLQSLRFYIMDTKSGKRTAVQEATLEPLYLHDKIQQVKGHNSERMVVALPQFTLTEHQRLFVEILEQGGGRHLWLKMRNLHLLHAKPIQ